MTIEKREYNSQGLPRSQSELFPQQGAFGDGQNADGEARERPGEVARSAGGSKRITSLSDPAVAPYCRLTEAQLRSQQGLFIAESPKVINVALNAGMEPVSLLTTERHIKGDAAPIIARCPEMEVLTADDALLEQITGFRLTRGVLCAMKRSPSPSGLPAAPCHPSPCREGNIPLKEAGASLTAGVSSPSLAHRANSFPNRGLLATAKMQMAEPERGREGWQGAAGSPDGERLGERLIVILNNVVEATNVGAIFRSAAALGVDGVILLRSCDPLNRRALRVSMGNVFLVPWTVWEGDDLSLYAALRREGFRTAALALTDDSVTLDDPALRAEPRLALIMGTEGDGLPRESIDDADYVVRIPMANGVDSLNVAAASAVAFYALKR